MITQTKRFAISHAGDFTCAYCGEKPGSSQIEIDHLLPRSLGGGDLQQNLVCSCQKCNRGKSNQIFFPPSMVIGVDDEGWSIHKIFGIWAVKSCPSKMVVEGAVITNDVYKSFAGYWITHDRWYEPDWIFHISEKTWGEPHKLSDFIQCLEYAKGFRDS